MTNHKVTIYLIVIYVQIVNFFCWNLIHLIW